MNEGGNYAYPQLEVLQILRSHGVRFGNHGYEVDSCTETLHDLHIKRFQPRKSKSVGNGHQKKHRLGAKLHSRVTGWFDKIETSVNAKVLFVHTDRLLLLAHIGLVLIVDKIDDRCPAVGGKARDFQHDKTHGTSSNDVHSKDDGRREECCVSSA